MPLTCSRAPLLVLCLILGTVGCHKPPQQEPDAHVVAMVNGEVLGRAEFEQELWRELSSAEGPERTPEEVEPFKRALLDTLVKRMLLLQQAKQYNLTVTQDEVDRRMLRLSGDYPAEGFSEVLAQGQMSLAELRAREANRLLIEKLFTNHVYARVAVTEEELRAAYTAHEAEFQEPEQVHAAQLVVKGLDEARRVQAQLKAGKKFADLARRYSLSADAKVGGDLGFFPRGQMPPAFDEVVFNLRPGQVSDVVSTEYGYHLFRVLEFKPARKRDFLEVRAKVEAREVKRKQEEAHEAFEKALLDKAKLWVNEPTLQSIRGRPVPQASAAKGR
ncbi:peptidyl-prolyl cis-trans isomerase [Stigmatella sp. ncwal1]|uniref:peptidylprolyl isomerase n=1 Tax=Stigmatella ashevillensis TaxID=2995309 RepID=A0ABT5DC39_9BACT|nr:peptidyl-prolyl cis-trans isomerase [Stigmatella ashevillena]MDC0711240.1 peptidyl-prolyl cis-trans isomerase [Stigmatella ashevillena]